MDAAYCTARRAAARAATLYAKRYHEASVHGAWRNWRREELIALWAEQAAVCARIALKEHVGDSRDREIVLAAALMRVAGVGNCRTYATPKEPLEDDGGRTAMFCDALDVGSPLRDVQSILSYPNARGLRDLLARNASRDTPPSVARRIRRTLGTIFVDACRALEPSACSTPNLHVGIIALPAIRQTRRC